MPRHQSRRPAGERPAGKVKRRRVKVGRPVRPGAWCAWPSGRARKFTASQPFGWLTRAAGQAARRPTSGRWRGCRLINMPADSRRARGHPCAISGRHLPVAGAHLAAARSPALARPAIPVALPADRARAPNLRPDLLRPAATLWAPPACVRPQSGKAHAHASAARPGARKRKWRLATGRGRGRVRVRAWRPGAPAPAGVSGATMAPARGLCWAPFNEPGARPIRRQVLGPARWRTAESWRACAIRSSYGSLAQRCAGPDTHACVAKVAQQDNTTGWLAGRAPQPAGGGLSSSVGAGCAAGRGSWRRALPSGK